MSPNKQKIAKQVKVCETGYPVSLGSETVCHENNRQMAFYLPLIRYFTLIYNLGYRIISYGYIPIFWYLISIGWYLIDIIWYLRQGGKVAGELVVLRTISSRLIKRWLLLEQTGKIFLSTPLHSFTSLLSQRWAKIIDIVKVIFRCLYFDEFNHRPIWLISC